MYITEEWVREHLPKRDIKGNKGSFGKLFALIGSNEYKGAAHLALEAALRGGVGYTHVAVADELYSSLICRFPEAIYHRLDGLDECTVPIGCDTVLIGCGCGVSEALYSFILRVLSSSVKNVILDADALNSIAKYAEYPQEVLTRVGKNVILTPHPLEMARLTHSSVEAVEADRRAAAHALAMYTGATVVLKGHNTVVASRDTVMLNTTGSSALAKAGSGDCLAGFLASLTATGLEDPYTSSAIAVFIHGMAGDMLSRTLSDFGVTPSDLPRKMAEVTAYLTQ
jgi:NAD(P)H-hydrate epimerase